jgi:hypothetical protein
MSSQWLKRWFPQLPGALDRAPMAGLMCAGALLLGVALAGARTSISGENNVACAKSPANLAVKAAVENQEKAARFREDEELIEMTGQFSMSGSRVTFTAAESRNRFFGLENLILQEVTEKIADNHALQTWIVSGKVTEYRGSNYLILTRAQLKADIPQAVSK